MSDLGSWRLPRPIDPHLEFPRKEYVASLLLHPCALTLTLKEDKLRDGKEKTADRQKTNGNHEL